MVVTRDLHDKNKNYIQNFSFKMVEKDSLEVTLEDKGILSGFQNIVMNLTKTVIS